MHKYVNDENWKEFHPNENFDDWLKWRLSVDRGETRSQTMIITKGEVGYESPSTGDIITSDKARREDLARSGCIEYDPEMKTDQNRRIAEEDKKLDKQFDLSLDAALDSLPADKVASLNAEMAQGMDVEISRLTVEEN